MSVVLASIGLTGLQASAQPVAVATDLSAAPKSVDHAGETSGKVTQQSENAVVVQAPAATPTVAGQITVFPDPGGEYPIGIVSASDGALWYTISGNSIGRITTAGVIKHYTAAGMSRPFGIAAGSDGALWFTDTGASAPPSIGRITTAGVVTFFTDPQIRQLDWIAAGPDGALWFTEFQGGGYTYPAIARITTDGTLTTFTDASISSPTGIAAGSDGALWFVNSQSPGNGDIGSIGRITTSGVVTQYMYAGSWHPYGIAAGPDGALWFTNGQPGTPDPPSIERITTAGVVTAFTDSSLGGLGGGWLGGGGGIAAGPDGALWFTNFGASTSAGPTIIGRVTITGAFTAYVTGSNVAANEMAAGPDHAMWFTMGTRGIGRVFTPVNTEITRSTISSQKHKATFSFRSVGFSTGFQCELKKEGITGARFATCSSPKTYANLQRGSYTFVVRARNSSRPDPTPARKTFTI